MLQQRPAGSGRVSLRVANVPAFVSEDEFGRVFRSSRGCLGTRRQGHLFYVDFGDILSAQKCKATYDNWVGWGSPGIQIEFDAGSYDQQQPQQQTVGNQAPGVYGLQQHQQQQHMQAGPARTQPTPPGLGMQVQQPAPQGQAASSTIPGARPPAGAPGSTGATGAAAPSSTSTGTGLAAAIAGLSPSQLSSLAGLLGQAVGQPGSAAAPAAQAAAVRPAALPPTQQPAPAPHMAPTQPQAAPQAAPPAPVPQAAQPASAPHGDAAAANQQQQPFGNLAQGGPTSAATSQLLSSLTAGGGLLGLQGAQPAPGVSQPAAPQQQLASMLAQLTGSMAGQQAATPQVATNPLLALLGSQLLGGAGAGQAAQPNLLQPTPSTGLPTAHLLAAALPQLQAAGLANLPQLQALLQLATQAQQPAAPQAPAPAPATQGPQPPPGNPPPQQAAPRPPGPAPPAGPPPPSSTPPAQPGLPDLNNLPPNASRTLFFDSLPLDLTKREAAHIFRPIQGYEALRTIVKEHPHRPGERSTKLFVDFVDAHSATAAMHLLAGYKLDLEDERSAVLKPMYGKPMPARALANAQADRDRNGPGPGPGPGYGRPGEDRGGGYEGRGQPAPPRAPATMMYPEPGYGAAPGMPPPYGAPPPGPYQAPPHAGPGGGGDHRRGGDYSRRGEGGRDRERERDARDGGGGGGRDREREREPRRDDQGGGRGGRQRTRWGN